MEKGSGVVPQPKPLTEEAAGLWPWGGPGNQGAVVLRLSFPPSSAWLLWEMARSLSLAPLVGRINGPRNLPLTGALLW